MERFDKDQRAERRANRREEQEQEHEAEREQHQYNTAETEGDRDDAGNQAGSSKRHRSDSSRRNRSRSVGRNAIVNFKLNLYVFQGRKKADPDVHIQAFEQWANLKG